MSQLKNRSRNKGEDPWERCYPEDRGVAAPPEDVDLDELDSGQQNANVVLERLGGVDLRSMDIESVEVQCECLRWGCERT